MIKKSNKNKKQYDKKNKNEYASIHKHVDIIFKRVY